MRLHWTDFFDQIFLINLKKRVDRLMQSAWELEKNDIPYTRWEATERENGQEGIDLTVRAIMSHCLVKGYKNVLLFEDDVEFRFPPDVVMMKALHHLPKDYDLLYLGVNPTKSYVPRFYSTNLLYLPRGYALHACAYSEEGMKKVLGLGPTLPIDWNIANNIHPQGKCYAVYPMICTQRPGYSDIEKKFVDWSYALEKRFSERLNLLIQKNNTNEQKSSESDQEKGG